MTDRKPRKKNPKTTGAATRKKGTPSDDNRQEPDATAAVLGSNIPSESEAAGNRDSEGEGQNSSALSAAQELPAGDGIDKGLAEDQRWDQPFPGGLNEPTSPAPPDSDTEGFPGGHNGGETSHSELSVFPGWSSDWQATTADAGSELSFPGGNNPVDDQFGEAAGPFPGGQNRQSPEAPADIAEDVRVTTEIAEVNSEKQLQPEITPVPESVISPPASDQKSRRRKK